MTNTKMPSEPHIHIETRPGRPLGPAKKLEKWINKKVPIGSALPFPDFHDVLRCVREANSEDRLGWNEVDIMEEARDLFTRCGKKLQRRRQENEWRLASCRIAHHADPAETSEDLKKKIEENTKIAATKEDELFKKYVDRQNQMNLEPVEIADKEADESPLESEEEDLVEEKNSLNSKQKRKDTLKRLIKERSKKKNKEIIPLENLKNDETKMAESKTNEAEATTKDDGSDKMDVDKALEDEQNDVNEAKQDKFEANEGRDSDDGNDIGSGIDELNLLSKLYSENELDSSEDCYDSDVSVITLDTLEMDSGNENDSQLISEDVISIENSSYSESESTMDGQDKKAYLKPSKDIKNIETKTLIAKNRSDRQVKIIENILLASSDEENSNPVKENVDYINLNDDSLSLPEAIVAFDTCDKENTDNVHSSVHISENTLQSESTTNKMDIDDKCVDENTATSSLILLQNNENGVDEAKEHVDASTSDAISVESVDSQIEETVQKGSPKQILNDNIIVQESEKDNNNSN